MQDEAFAMELAIILYDQDRFACCKILINYNLSTFYVGNMATRYYNNEFDRIEEYIVREATNCVNITPSFFGNVFTTNLRPTYSSFVQ